MTVQYDSSIPQVRVDDPIKSRHDLKTTRQSIKELLAHGIPDWMRFPEDYKEFCKESFAAEREQSLAQVAQYRMPGQEILSDPKPRMINIMATIEFLRKLKNNGIKCFTFNNPMMPQTVGLWAVPPMINEAVYVAYMQVPCMYEWSVLRLDKYGLPNGEDYRGWRTVLAQLIVKEIVTEQKAHQIFGEPSGAQSIIYRRTLWNFRNGVARGPGPSHTEL